MTQIVPADKIELIVGTHRHPTLHIARAISFSHSVYILHSAECLDACTAGDDTTRPRDLRDCEYSAALDNGIHIRDWTEDTALVVGIADTRLVPVTICPECAQGKHVNCTRTIPTDNYPQVLPCPCGVARHLTPIPVDEALR